MKKKMTIDTLARMTQDEFSRTGTILTELKDGQQRLEVGQQRILEVLLEIPPKRLLNV